MGKDDPMMLADLDAANIEAAVAAKKEKKKAPPTELEIKKEERLAQKEQRMATIAGMAGPSGAPPLPELPTVDKSKLLDKISMYRERFPQLKQRNKLTMKSSVDEIEDEMHYIEMQLSGSAGDSSLGMMVLVAGMSGLEAVTRDIYNPLGLNLTGLGSVTRDNADTFKPLVDELMIKYGAGTYVAPEYRLALAIGATVYSVHMANSGDPTIAAAMEKMSKQAPEPASNKKDL